MEALLPPQTQMLKKNKSMLFNYNLEQKRRGGNLNKPEIKKEKRVGKLEWTVVIKSFRSDIGPRSQELGFDTHKGLGFVATAPLGEECSN